MFHLEVEGYWYVHILFFGYLERFLMYYEIRILSQQLLQDLQSMDQVFIYPKNVNFQHLHQPTKGQIISEQPLLVLIMKTLQNQQLSNLVHILLVAHQMYDLML